jgi:hypothetical protein
LGYVLESLNQSPNSLLENSCQGEHEAGEGQKSDVGLGVPVVSVPTLPGLAIPSAYGGKSF